MAELQHITYTEYLPLILGDTVMAEIVKTKQYNNTLDASVSNAFATAAFRFGHSMIPENLTMTDSACPRATVMSRPLEDLFFKPSLVHDPRHFVMSLAGFCDAASPNPGTNFASSVNGKLFIHREEEGAGVGLDLVSINIQRGRDHGLPGYNQFRFGLSLQLSDIFCLQTSLWPQEGDVVCRP